MQVNQATLSALFKGYRVIFSENYQGTAPMWDQFAMRTSSSAAEELYHWLGAVPGMKRMLGGITIENLSANKYTIANDEWEDTVAVKQADIERDTYGIYNPMFAMMGVAAKEHPDEIVSDLMLNGFTADDYTGTPFFSADKVQDQDTKSPYTLTNNGTAALTATSFAAARAAMKTFVNSKGRPMGIGKNLLLVVGPTNEVNALQICQADLIAQTATNTENALAAAAVSNVNKGTAKPIVFPRLGDSPAWFLLEAGYPIRPLIVQIEKEVAFTALTQPDSDHVFKNHEFLYQGYGRYQGGYGLPQFAWGSTGESDSIEAVKAIHAARLKRLELIKKAASGKGGK